MADDPLGEELHPGQYWFSTDGYFGERMRTPSAGLPDRRLKRDRIQKQIDRVMDRLRPKLIPVVIVNDRNEMFGFTEVKYSERAVTLPDWADMHRNRIYRWDGSMDEHGRRIYR